MADRETFRAWLQSLPPTTLAAIDVAELVYHGPDPASGGLKTVLAPPEWCDEADLLSGRYPPGSLWRAWTPDAILWTLDHADEPDELAAGNPIPPAESGVLPNLPSSVAR